MESLRLLRARYGKTPAMFVQHIHRLCKAMEQVITVRKVIGAEDGTYVYPYPYFMQEQGFTATHCNMVLKQLRDKDLVCRVALGKTPFYRLNYQNQEIIDSGFEDPNELTKDIAI